MKIYFYNDLSFCEFLISLNLRPNLLTGLVNCDEFDLNLIIEKIFEKDEYDFRKKQILEYIYNKSNSLIFPKIYMFYFNDYFNNIFSETEIRKYKIKSLYK